MIAKYKDWYFPLTVRRDSGTYEMVSHAPFEGFERDPVSGDWMRPVEDHKCMNLWFTFNDNGREVHIADVRNGVMRLVTTRFDDYLDYGWTLASDGGVERFLKLQDEGYWMHLTVYGAGKDHEVTPLDRRRFLDLWLRTRIPPDDRKLVRWMCSETGIFLDEGRRLLDRYKARYGLYRELCMVYDYGGIPGWSSGFKAAYWGAAGISEHFPELPPLGVMGLLLRLCEDPNASRSWMEDADRRGERRGFNYREIDALMCGGDVQELVSRRDAAGLLQEFSGSGYYTDGGLHYKWLGVCERHEDMSLPGTAYVYEDEAGRWFFAENDEERPCVGHKCQCFDRQDALDCALYEMQRGNFRERRRLRNEDVEERLRDGRYAGPF